MPKYLIEGTYSADAAKGVAKDGGSSRRQAVEQMVKSVGGRIEAFYFAFGSRDYVIICEVPDNATAVAVSVAVASSGATHPSTTPLMSPEEFDQAVKKHAAYKAPGQ